jgi:hypothetical protein
VEKFKATYQGADDVIRKSITFFLNAANDAQIPISSFIMKARKPRSGPSKRRGVRNSGAAPKGDHLPEEDGDDSDNTDNVPPVGLLVPEYMKQLLEKFPTFDPAWPEQVQAKWFDAFESLMSRVDRKDD